jgi:hypothetical protein
VASEIVAGYADCAFQVDSRDPLATLEQLQAHGCSAGADLVLACHNATGCEGATVLATKPCGYAIFFSMATSFSQANLATDIAGKEVRCLFGVGLAEQQHTEMFTLLRFVLLLVCRVRPRCVWVAGGACTARMVGKDSMRIWMARSHPPLIGWLGLTLL